MLDLKNSVTQQTAMEAFFLGYQAFTAKADEMLARRGLGRVHHRILFFIARYPGLSVKELLAALGVSKQALNIPLRRLTKQAAVFSAELRSAFIAYQPSGAPCIDVLIKHQMPRFL